MCGRDFHIYILNLYTMKGNKFAIIIFTLNVNIPLRHFLYLACI